MSDKQITGPVQLSVRISAQLKRQLDIAAKARRSSLSAEVTRALTEQYDRLATDQVRMTQLGVGVSVLEAQLTFLENRILELTEAAPLGLLQSLQSGIIQRRLAKLEMEKEAARRSEQIREAANAAHVASNRHASPFDGLVNPTAEEVEERAAQLDVTERRRLNLLVHLDAGRRGAKRDLAAALGWSRARVSHVLAPPYLKQHRPLSDATAKRIEVALQLKAGELDKLELDRSRVQWHQILQKFDVALAGIHRTLQVDCVPLPTGKS
ncbi:hypothetical protein DBR42_04465 [Pelomonas sp. HMWF004]|nr:hypothetical protein DBR42_04465 [Pelomonas sp. HMWF004]